MVGIVRRARVNLVLCAHSHPRKRESGTEETSTTLRGADKHERQTTMGLFQPDLYRSLFIGFLIGCAGLAASAGGEARAEIAAHVLGAG